MDIVINIDHNYLPYAIVMLESFFRHNQEESRVHLLHASMAEEDIGKLRQFVARYHGKLETYQVEESLFEGFPDLQRWSVETLFRLLIPEVLPKHLERALYLDADVIVEKPLRQFYAMDFQGKSMVVCRNTDGKVDEEEKNRIWKRKDGTAYFNAGVMLLNLEKMRQICSFERYSQEVQNAHGLFPLLDQDLLNYVLGEDVLYMPASEYNCIVSPDSKNFSEDTAIYHFGTAQKPWGDRKPGRYYDVWWNYAESLSYCE